MPTTNNTVSTVGFRMVCDVGRDGNRLPTEEIEWVPHPCTGNRKGTHYYARIHEGALYDIGRIHVSNWLKGRGPYQIRASNRESHTALLGD